MRACSVSEQWLSRWWRGQHESGSPSFSITSKNSIENKDPLSSPENKTLTRLPTLGSRRSYCKIWRRIGSDSCGLSLRFNLDSVNELHSKDNFRQLIVIVGALRPDRCRS
jgi:hypothetical protein